MAMDDQSGSRGIERKRPVNIGALASEVLSVLSDRQGSVSPGVRTFVMDHLMRALVAGGGFDASGLLDQLKGHRLTIDQIIDDYVPGAAMRLGEDWVDDGLSFADVTIGTMRLQTLLGEATGRGEIFEEPGGELRGLIVVPNGEQHFLGASVLSAQLRRLGVSVATSFDERGAMLGTRLLVEQPNMVLITCGSYETIESVANTVQTIKSTLNDIPPIILGGACVHNNNKLKKRTGVDLVTSRAGEAVALAAARIANPKKS